MKIVTGIFLGGVSEFDFEGFSGDDCGNDENALRVFLARMGIETEIIDEHNKDRQIKVPEGPIKNRIKQ